MSRPWWRYQSGRVATSFTVSLADLKRHHTIADLIDYVEILEWQEDEAAKG